MLKGIYIFFIGVLAAVVIGTGIAAFYPAPKPPQASFSSGAQTKAGEQRLQRAWTTYSDALAAYQRNASLVAFALGLALGIAALAFSAKIPVIGDGMLLGGMFTIVYGVGIGVMSGSDKFRFVIGLLGLGAAIAIGYVKFVRPASGKLESGIFA